MCLVKSPYIISSFNLDYFNVSMLKLRFSAQCDIWFPTVCEMTCTSTTQRDSIHSTHKISSKAIMKFGLQNTHVYRPLFRSTICIIHSNIIEFSLARNCSASTTSSTASQKLDKSRPEFLKSPGVNKRVNT